MFKDLHVRSRKAGQPPGTLCYVGTNFHLTPNITTLIFNKQIADMKSGPHFEPLESTEVANPVTWIHVEGLKNIDLVKEVAETYKLHPLTIEDILNVNHPPKIEEFEDYIYITLKILHWNVEKHNFTIINLSLVIGEDFVLTFQDDNFSLFNSIRERIHQNPQNLRRQTAEYLAYRLIDIIIDQYFVVLEEVGNRIEAIEDSIIFHPSKDGLHHFYQLRHQLLILRKIIWPTREILSNLSQENTKLISSFTHVYLRDAYDHIAQAMDTVETFREMISNLVDIYLSNLSYRMNDIMKILTIIMTTFIPASFIASIYGMNFHYMPELAWKWSYPVVLLVIVSIICSMLFYYRYKKWW